MTKARWESHRGDEWWYSDSILEANAGFNRIPPALVIGELNILGSALTAHKLHLFLWHTQQQMKDVQVWILLTSLTRPLIKSLEESQKIRWQSIRNPLSEEARIIFVADPNVT